MNRGEERDERSGRQLYYLVMEYMGGGDLNSVCRMKPLLLEDAVVYLGQICSALSCAHEHGVIHRDIKPNNLLLSEDGSVVKLLDFGTARLLENQNGIITRVGTPVYSAPESYSPDESVRLTRAADIYSLAKLLLFMLTGDSPSHLAQKQINLLPTTLTNQPWSHTLLAVLKKATREEAEERYQTVDEFQRDLRSVLEWTEVFVRPAQKKVPGAHTSYRPPKHSRFEVPVPNNPVLAYASIAATFSGRERQLIERIERAVRFIPMKLVLRILLVVIITGLLLVGSPPILRWWRGPSPQTANVRDTPEPQSAMTVTDLNIRSGPGQSEQKIGLAERSSRVRVLSCNPLGTWCEIEVVQHGRSKLEPTSADRGWVNKKFLIF